MSTITTTTTTASVGFSGVSKGSPGAYRLRPASGGRLSSGSLALLTIISMLVLGIVYLVLLKPTNDVRPKTIEFQMAEAATMTRAPKQGGMPPPPVFFDRAQKYYAEKMNGKGYT